MVPEKEITRTGIGKWDKHIIHSAIIVPLQCQQSKPTGVETEQNFNLQMISLCHHRWHPIGSNSRCKIEHNRGTILR